jgi:tape measure domain-containing protein
MAIKAGTAYIAFEPMGLADLRARLMAAITAAATAAARAGNTALNNAGGAGTAGTSAFARMAAAIGTASTALRTLGTALTTLGFQLQILGATMSLVFTAPIALITTAGLAIGVKYAANVETATAALKALLPAGYDVAALMDRLAKVAVESPVFAVDDLVTFTQKMVASGQEISKVETFLKAFGNVATTTGVSTDKMSRALEAVSQMASKGTVNMEELRQQLGEAMPGALKLVADGLGITQAKLYDLVAEGKISATDVMDAFIKIGNSATYLNGASAAADTLTGRWQALKESIQVRLGEAVMDNMDAIKKAFDDATPAIYAITDAIGASVPTIVDYLGKLVTKINELREAWGKLNPEQQKMVMIIAALMVTLGPLLVILGTLLGAIGTIVTAVSFLISPSGLVVIAFAALAAGAAWLYFKLKDLWESSEAVRKKFGEFKDKAIELFTPLKEAASTIIPSCKKAWDEFKDSMSEIDWGPTIDLLKVLGKLLAGFILGNIIVVIGVIGGLAGSIGKVVEALGHFIAGLVKVVTGIINFVAALAVLDFGGMWDALKQITDGLVELIWDTLWDAVTAILDFCKWFYNTTIGLFKELMDKLVGHSIVPDMVDAIVECFSTLVTSVVQILASFPSKIAGKFTEMKDQAVARVSALVSSAASKFRELISRFAEIANGVKDKVQTVFDRVKALPGQIVSAIGSLGSILYSAGKSVIQGLINGIDDKVGALKSKASSIANSIRDTISSALNIGSPSKVMFELGRFATEGLVLGLSADSSDLVTAAKTLASTTIAPIEGAAETSTVARNAALNIGTFVANSKASAAELAEEILWMSSTRGWAL